MAIISFQTFLVPLSRNSVTHSNRLILWRFTIQHWHGGLEPCLMCGCCVNLWPGLSGGPQWRGVKVKGKWEVGPVCGKHLTGARSPRLGPQKPDSSRRLLEGRRCCVWSFGEPLVPTLSVPIPLSCPAGGTEGQLMLVTAPVLEEKPHKFEHPLSFRSFYF